MTWLLIAQLACACPTNGARAGETLEQRIERLRAEIDERQTALRLSLAEKRVRGGRK